MSNPQRKVRQPPNPKMCLVGYWDHGKDEALRGEPRFMEIAESALPWAYAQGWSLVLRYRDDPAVADDTNPAQRGPNRVEDDEGD